MDSNTDRRTYLKGILGAGSGMAIAGCQGDEEADAMEDIENPEELPEEEMTIGHVVAGNEDNYIHAAYVEAANFIEEVTGGQLQVNVAPGGEMGGAIEMMEMAQEGALECVGTAAIGTVAPFYPDIQALHYPGIFEDHRLGHRVMDGPWGQEFFENMRQETGLRQVCFLTAGYRNWFTNEKIESISDMEDMVIRSQELSIHESLLESVGATAEVVPFGELYEALDTGAVDGQYQSIAVVIFNSLYEVQSHLLIDRMLWGMENTFVSDSWYQDLHPVYQQVIDRAFLVGRTKGRQMVTSMEEHGVETLQERGVEVTEITGEEREQAIEQVREPLESSIRDEMDNPEVLDDLIEATEQAREELGYPPHNTDL